MAIRGRQTLRSEDINCIASNEDILRCYFHIEKIPCLIKSPFRKDNNPSFCVYYRNANEIRYIDYSTGEHGGVFDMVGRLLGLDFKETMQRIYNDFKIDRKYQHIERKEAPQIRKESSSLSVRTREWRQHDVEYWESYGVNMELLKKAGVLPVDRIFYNGYVNGAMKHAYAFVEHKEGGTSIKVYQPYAPRHRKWMSSNDSSVIMLWSMMPESGDIICICSSLKDALCLTSNTGIPAIAPQSEAQKGISNTAMSVLKSRFKRICIMYDNDEAGLSNSRRIADEHNIEMIVLPDHGAKDVSDLYKALGDAERFREIITEAFNKCR